MPAHSTTLRRNRSDVPGRNLWRYLLQPTAALNLAVLRVAVFGLLLARLIPEFETWSSNSVLTAAIIATAFALVGCFTRVTSLVSVLLAAWYVYVSYTRGAFVVLSPILSFGLVLACSRSGDAVSLDAIWQSLWQADHGRIRRSPHSIRYGMPLRWAMLIFAVGQMVVAVQPCLRFGSQVLTNVTPTELTLKAWPGLVGTDVIDPATVAPPLPTVLTGAMLMIGLAWPAAVLWRPTRWLWVTLSALLSVVALWPLSGASLSCLALYVVFVDWQRILAWLGTRLQSSPTFVLYDGNCKMCRRTMSVLLSFDWLHSLSPISAFDRDRICRVGLGHLADADLMKDMHAGSLGRSGDWRIEKGYQAYQMIAWRVPLLWPTLLFIYLYPVVWIGNCIYRQVADNRACSVPTKPVVAEHQLFGWSPLLVSIVAVVIITGQLVVGLVEGIPQSALPSPGETAVYYEINTFSCPAATRVQDAE